MNDDANLAEVLAASHTHIWVEQKEGRDCPVKASDWCQQIISTCDCGAIKYHECQAPACIYWAPPTQIIESANTDFDDRIELHILTARMRQNVRIEVLGERALLSIRIMAFKAYRDIHHSA